MVGTPGRPRVVGDIWGSGSSKAIPRFEAAARIPACRLSFLVVVAEGLGIQGVYVGSTEGARIAAAKLFLPCTCAMSTSPVSVSTGCAADYDEAELSRKGCTKLSRWSSATSKSRAMGKPG